MSTFIDFKEIKDKVPIERTFDFLNLKMKQHGNAFRGSCPACNSDSDRNLVVTPSKGVFYCFAAQQGGDVLALTAHILGGTAKEAAATLHDEFIGTADDEEEVVTTPKERGMEPLSYLESDHPAVVALQFPDDVIDAAGIGYAKKGTLRGNVCLPMRLPDGTLIGYVGVQDATLPLSWKL